MIEIVFPNCFISLLCSMGKVIRRGTLNLVSMRDNCKYFAPAKNENTSSQQLKAAFEIVKMGRFLGMTSTIRFAENDYKNKWETNQTSNPLTSYKKTDFQFTRGTFRSHKNPHSRTSPFFLLAPIDNMVSL